MLGKSTTFLLTHVTQITNTGVTIIYGKSTEFWRKNPDVYAKK
jgi:hypothetical protein